MERWLGRHTDPVIYIDKNDSLLTKCIPHSLTHDLVTASDRWR